MLRLSTYSSHAPIRRINTGPVLALATLSAAASKKTCTTTTRITVTSRCIGHSPSRSLMQAARAGGSGGASEGQGGFMVANPMPTEEIRGNDLLLALGLRRERMPKHVGVTLDGNRRWSLAYNNGQLTYEPFYRNYIMFADLCIKLGIPVASCFIFSTCTLKRTEEANNIMFKQFQASLEDNIEKFVRQGIKVLIFGEKWRLPKSLQNTIKQVEEATTSGTTLEFTYAIPYGGRTDIVEAARRISKKVKDKEIKLEDIDEVLVEQELSTGILSIPNPDLMIRNGGKRRISNFYLWQASHAELYFNDTLSSEFGESGFIDALRWFQQCERRFGK